MIDGRSMVLQLEARRAAGAPRGDLLSGAVQLVEAAEDTYDWVGIYLLQGYDLVLHDYVGAATEHTRIAVGQGVCGTAVAEDRDINVPDVRAIENYIACSVGTVSELVVLIRSPATGKVVGQLDLDSDRPAAFGERDEIELKIVADWLGGLF